MEGLRASRRDTAGGTDGKPLCAEDVIRTATGQPPPAGFSYKINNL
jgi:hypothetical protein